MLPSQNKDFTYSLTYLIYGSDSDESIERLNAIRKKYLSPE